MVFYFTATGNSLYIAKNIDENPISIPQAIHRNDLIFEDETIGIVCPIFGHEVPPMVRDFISKSVFKTDYFYMVLTYGNRHGGAAELAEGMLKGFGISAAYINTIMMVDNFLPAFDMNEQIKIDKMVDENISTIKDDIKNRRKMIQQATDADRAAHKEFLSRSTVPPSERFKNLYRIEESCTGCGICTRVCPAKCFSVKNGKAAYSDSGCQACMSCIHNCPQKAIQLNIPEKNPNARYINEHITLAEIIQSNNQNK